MRVLLVGKKSETPVHFDFNNGSISSKRYSNCIQITQNVKIPLRSGGIWHRQKLWNSLDLHTSAAGFGNFFSATCSCMVSTSEVCDIWLTVITYHCPFDLENSSIDSKTVVRESAQKFIYLRIVFTSNKCSLESAKSSELWNLHTFVPSSAYLTRSPSFILAQPVSMAEGCSITACSLGLYREAKVTKAHYHFMKYCSAFLW